MEVQDKNLLHSKQHFQVLDGLRGVAAIAVVIFHFMEIAITDYPKNFIAHGFLAVDFFFCLSGFVIAFAYDDRISALGFKKFITSRLIRLYPLVVLGSVLGLLGYLFDPFEAMPKDDFFNLFMVFLASILLIPYPVMEHRFFNLFSLNAPAWSLFWEFVANIFYVVILFKLSRTLLLILMGIAATILIYIAFHSNNLMGGWGGPTFWDGGARIFFSFIAGMCIYRFNWILKTRIGFWPLVLLLLLSFVIPYHESSNYWVEPIIILLYYPLLIALGAGSLVASKSVHVARFSGEISYPLYMTHYVFLWIFAHFYAKYPLTAFTLTLTIFMGLVLTLFVAYLALKYYDLPLRKYLHKIRNQGI